MAKSTQCSPQQAGDGGPCSGSGGTPKAEVSLAPQRWQCHVVLSAVPPREHHAQGQEQLCTCPALVFRN